MFVFLIAFFLFMDAVLTIEYNASFYLVTVMHFSENAKAALYLLLLSMAVLGALLPAYFGKRSTQKGMLIAILWGWVASLIFISITKNPVLFAALFATVGLLYGALGNVARVLFLQMTPQNRTAQHFGVYASLERVATFIGPLLWIATSWLMRGFGADRYRFSMITMAILVCVSIILLTKISDPADMEDTCNTPHTQSKEHEG